MLIQGLQHLLPGYSQRAVTQVTVHHPVQCLLIHMLCQYNMSCSNVLAKMHLQRCCDCSQYRRQLVDQTGQYYFIAVCLVLLVAQQYKPKHAFLVVSLYASSKDSLFSFKQLHCSSSKLSGFGDGLTQNCLCAAHRLLCKSVHYNLTATNCYCHVTGPRCHPG